MPSALDVQGRKGLGISNFVIGKCCHKKGIIDIIEFNQLVMRVYAVWESNS
jgi:hypothetical protein